MDVFGNRENVLLSYGNTRRTFGSTDDVAVDFDDVFGGPPRRSSVQEARYKLNLDDSSELPVFGEEIVRPRRQTSDDFYDDIFRGSEDSFSSPRRSSNPSSSRVLSPAHPLPARPELLGTSLPTHFSLPAKLINTTDLPTFGSSNRSTYKYKEGNLNVHSTGTSLSRFSSEASQGHDDLSNKLKPSNKQSLLSRESSLKSEESTEMDKLTKKDVGGDSKMNPKNEVAPNNGRRFHFSIYKWAGTEIPRLSLLRAKKVFNETEGITKSEKTAEKNSKPTQSSDELGLTETMKEEISKVVQEVNSPEFKSLLSLLLDDSAEKGDKKITRKAETKENVEVTTSVSHSNVKADRIKKQDSKETNTKGELNDKAGVSRIKSRDNLVNTRAKGRVNEFVNIYNSETPPMTKTDVSNRNERSRSKAKSTTEAAKEMTESTAAVESRTADTNVTEASFRESSNTEKPKEQPSGKEPTKSSSENFSFQRDASTFSDSLDHGPKFTLDMLDDHFQDFQVKELSIDENKQSTGEEDYEAIQASDAKIQKWSSGKKGNIRSLLSTLQNVLWPESGWKPVPLVDIIEGNAVKRAYQKALLCLHPDKLQQKGAAAHQKYLAEKVFDILQEAWDHFNTSLGSL